MSEYRVKILNTEFITPDVKRLTVEKPKGYVFTPGQATDVAIDAVMVTSFCPTPIAIHDDCDVPRSVH